jgi:hypothetical protein
VVLLELERRGAVESVREAVLAERARVEGLRTELATLEGSIEQARAAMKRFRGACHARRGAPRCLERGGWQPRRHVALITTTSPSLPVVSPLPPTTLQPSSSSCAWRC